MKTSIDIPETELLEVMKRSGAKTKKEAVLTAIAEYNRRKRAAGLVKLLGTFQDSFPSHDDFEQAEMNEGQRYGSRKSRSG